MLDAGGRRSHELYVGIDQQRGIDFGDGSDDQRVGVPNCLAGDVSSRKQGHGPEMRKCFMGKRNIFIDDESHVFLTRG